MMLAIDWAKAFHSVDPLALQSALERFGCPNYFVNMVVAVYTKKTFVVADNGVVSGRHQQHNGTAQGCPLSLFLSSIGMTMLLHDANDSRKTGTTSPDLSERVYANDTLLTGVDEGSLQTFMMAIGQIVAENGLSMSVLQLEKVRCITCQDNSLNAQTRWFGG